RKHRISAGGSRFGSLAGQGADQAVEACRVFQKAVRETELRVEDLIAAAGGDDEVVFGEQVATLVPLHAVAQVDGHGDGASIASQQPLPADGEQVGDAG